MRRIVFAFLLAFGLVAWAAAQTVQFESFDRAGLPARPRTAEERDLLQRISAHRRGDAAGAAEIQRRLAQYYRANGDDQRARMAEDRANAAASYTDPATGRPYGSVQAPQYGTVPGPAYGTPQGRRPNYEGSRTPNYGGLPMPVYGTMPARKSSEPDAPMLGAPVRPAPGEATPPPAGSAIPIYQPETPAPAASSEAGQTGATTSPLAPAAEPLPAAAPPQDPAANVAAQPSDFSGRFFVLQGQTLHTWEFRPDGTFEHAWSARGGTTANFEAGKFQMAGPYMMLFVMRGSMLGGGVGARRDPRRVPFQMRGAGGKDGIVLDGLPLAPKP